MDNEKIGSFIKAVRIKKNMTQKELADKLNLSDKTISKWERGVGLPDLSVVLELSDILEISIESLLNGGILPDFVEEKNMKDAKYYVCPICKNISVYFGNPTVSCCGRKLEESVPKKADEIHDLSIEQVEDEWFITSSHPMEKGHYISFVAFVTGEKSEMIKQYPEWNLACRFKKRGHGKLIFYCSKDGLFYKNI